MPRQDWRNEHEWKVQAAFYRSRRRRSNQQCKWQGDVGGWRVETGGGGPAQPAFKQLPAPLRKPPVKRHSEAMKRAEGRKPMSFRVTESRKIFRKRAGFLWVWKADLRCCRCLLCGMLSAHSPSGDLKKKKNHNSAQKKNTFFLILILSFASMLHFTFLTWMAHFFFSFHRF